MRSYKSKFITNLYENTIISEMSKVYGANLYEKCFMDISSNHDLLPLYLDMLYASLVTVIKKPEGDTSYGIKDTNIEQLDILSLELEEQVGAFKGQYDVIVAFNILSTYGNDRVWQACVENLLYYLKPKGLCFVNGAFLDNKHIEYDKRYRSRGLWRAIVKHCGCSILDIIDNPSVSFCKNNKIMVIQR